MAVLFTPQRIAFNNVVIAIGAALATQATYTVPALMRAELYFMRLLISPNGATIGTGTLRVLINAVPFIALNCQNTNLAGGNVEQRMCLIDLVAGDTVNLQTAGGAVAAITMSGSCFIREYT